MLNKGFEFNFNISLEPTSETFNEFHHQFYSQFPLYATNIFAKHPQILKDWLKQRKQAFSEEAKDFGLPLPKGVLLVGPQGTGKTLVAKAIANSWSMPLLRLDVGRLFAGLVGASEARTRETIFTQI